MQHPPSPASSSRQQLPARDAHLIATSLSILYIAGYYLSHQPWRRAADRTDPSATVKLRLITIVATCVLAAAVLHFAVYLRLVASPSLIEFLALLGIRWDGLLTALVAPVGLIALLFAGPLFHMYLDRELFFQDEIAWDLFVTRLGTAQGQRHYLLGPVCEEFIFRACIIMPYYYARATWTQMVLLTPLYFGAAHLHNIYDIYSRSGRNLDALKRAVISSLFQLTYTTLFGWIAAFLYIRTGHIVSVMLVHSFCNIMGVPNIADIHLTRHPRTVWGIYVIGVVLFFMLAFPLTTPSLYANTIFVAE
ncbi:hypothetical protein BC828DRAFT_376370 [Blastocladiella britannica]|nr:hypothetical protein BC828DRAFT_376370 [Blastocladiella britannica]